MEEKVKNVKDLVERHGGGFEKSVDRSLSNLFCCLMTDRKGLVVSDCTTDS